MDLPPKLEIAYLPQHGRKKEQQRQQVTLYEGKENGPSRSGSSTNHNSNNDDAVTVVVRGTFNSRTGSSKAAKALSLGTSSTTSTNGKAMSKASDNVIAPVSVVRRNGHNSSSITPRTAAIATAASSSDECSAPASSYIHCTRSVGKSASSQAAVKVPLDEIEKKRCQSPATADSTANTSTSTVSITNPVDDWWVLPARY